MSLLVQYWPAALIGALVALALLYLLLRPRQRVTLTDSAPVRPHMSASRDAPTTGLAATAAATILSPHTRDPLTRRIVLDGPADDFQRSEIKRMSEELPGIATAHWTGFADRDRQLPLLAEVALMVLACFAAGVILAYVAALRRRSKEALLQ